MQKIDFKEMAHNSLKDITTRIHISYLAVYDMAEDPENTDAKFIKEIANLLLPISAVMEVYTRDQYIEPAYALEKLKHAQMLLNHHIRYWEKKAEENING